jgi:hypothetical protein
MKNAYPVVQLGYQEQYKYQEQFKEHKVKSPGEESSFKDCLPRVSSLIHMHA